MGEGAGSSLREFHVNGSKLSFNEPMSRHTSWRAGGVADRFYQASDLEDMREFLTSLPVDEPVEVVGLGSNLLVRDGGLRGTVLLTHGALGELKLIDNNVIYVQAGVPGAKLARFAALNNLTGAAFCAGIPGTLGGMLAMNAGCYGSEIWGYIVKVQVLTRHGELLTRTPDEYEISYRQVALKSATCKDHAQCMELFVGAWFSFEKGDGAMERQQIRELLAKRINSQPLNLPNAGSVFRNPPGNHAARLIEDCGLKGARVGAAEVSGKHANFIVNTGGASAADIETLIYQVRDTVADRTGVVLHMEVKIIGEELACIS
jgi:UDP-N-acetylmuramate dehydrogenase